MILLNFSHPLTDEQLVAIRRQLDRPDLDLRQINTHFDHERPFPDQATALLNQIDLTPQAWQTEPILVNPPSHNLVALTLLAELNGRMGYFPAVIRLKPVSNSLPPRFEFAEIVNLQVVRDAARRHRYE
jgi:hypothetical protein